MESGLIFLHLFIIVETRSNEEGYAIRRDGEAVQVSRQVMYEKRHN